MWNKNIDAVILIVLSTMQVLSNSTELEHAPITRFPRDVVTGIMTCLEEAGINICSDDVPSLYVLFCALSTEYSESVDSLLDIRDYFDEFLSIRDSPPDSHEALSRLARECTQATATPNHPNQCQSVEIASVALHQHSVVDVHFIVAKCSVDKLLNAFSQSSNVRTGTNHARAVRTDTHAVDALSKRTHTENVKRPKPVRGHRSSAEIDSLRRKGSRTRPVKQIST
ncbi:hypothetical protein RF11_06570 [Thelohanellus kitauei]|uniref:Uncharacterized protein n=1 Tax=Thelohanellus kitauei TaxID=669202 RepID=A0A0C2M4A1_THEKT|nr:hypothetical protein RF11_06570 [Thelohanellus kitauei]